MTIKEKLELKHWKIDYAVICDNGMYFESNFVVEALDISAALNRASDVLSIVAHQESLKKWTIWNMGIVEDNVL